MNGGIMLTVVITVLM